MAAIDRSAALRGAMASPPVGALVAERDGKCPAVDLSVLGEREGLQEDELGRRHVLGQPGPQEGLKIPDCRRRSRPGNDVADQLPIPGDVLARQDRAGLDPGMTGQGGLNLPSSMR